MVDSDSSCGRFQGDATRRVDGSWVDRPDEPAGCVMVQYRAAMAARHDHEAAIVEAHVVDHDANREDVIVGMRVESPVLVPLNGAAATRWLHVHLCALVAKVGTNELRDDAQSSVDRASQRRRPDC